ncbi:MAG: bacteriophage abortive infection AbiH family protein [Thermoproteota archaeon]|nr:bacteriophage abortive infection AbiH family protein [Thermoproteota archaeon]
MNTLYIIGNGFDLHHNLQTSYCDFHRYIKKNNKDLQNTLEEYFDFKIRNDKLWENFEEDLATFDSRSFFDKNNHIDVMDESFRRNFMFGLEDDLKEQTEQLISDIRIAFGDWLNSIDIESTSKKLPITQNAFFINFNYTLVLEHVYKIQEENILHIHGDINNDSELLIFGHNIVMEEEPELDEDGNSSRTLYTDSESAAKHPFHEFYKPVPNIISENSKAFKLASNVKNIFILGHSLNQIDIPYFKEIIIHTNNPLWNVSYYNNDERKRHLSVLNQIGIPNELIKMLRLKDYK